MHYVTASRFPCGKRGLKCHHRFPLRRRSLSLSPQEAWIEISVNKKEAVAPTIGKPVEDLQGPSASYTVSAADALIGGKDRKGRYYVKDVDSFAGSMDWND